MRSMTLTYEWQQFYKAAISEADPRKMRDDIRHNEGGTRNSTAPGDCPPSIMDAAEKRAIGDTLAALAVLKTDIA